MASFTTLVYIVYIHGFEVLPKFSYVLQSGIGLWACPLYIYKQKREKAVKLSLFFFIS